MTDIVIKIRPIDMAAKGSYRQSRDINKLISEAQRIGNWRAMDLLIDTIIKNSDIEAPDGVDARETLTDYAMKDIIELVLQIGGARVAAVPPPNGG